MGRPFFERLDGHIYSCVCGVPIVRKEALLSKAFHARSGKAYLFHNAVNVYTGAQEERMMTTGMHLVSDIFCVSCCSCIGWRYDFAFEKPQKYKEKKIILERSMVVRTYHGDDPACELESDSADEGY
ncbi:hypothetical protein FOA52_005999 [Chlamydomonas sp. UWO 241]|nr:hypothetical protein FOA52_005999 [Chlamydomonas sp. UWO 241]